MRLLALALTIVVALTLLIGGTACLGKSDADQAAENLGKAAEQFEVPRRIVFFNGITDKYLLEVRGYCSVESFDSGLAGALEVTCRSGTDGKATFTKHFLGLSDNVSYIVEQLEGIEVSATYPRVIFKPESIVPDFDRP